MHWTDSFLKKWAGTRLAHEAVMMEDAKKVLQHNREQLTGRREKQGEADPDDMQVGDNNYTIYGSNSKAASSMLPALGAAALGVGGTLAAVSLINQPAPPAIVPSDHAPIVQPADPTPIPDYVIIPRAPQ